jgi:fumarate reductase flavoprotein subunit
MSPKSVDMLKNLEADVVIIGSGGGLSAATAAAEKGVKSIIVLEKQDEIGGNVRYGNGLFACESPIQKRDQIIADKDECFKTFMKWVHWSRVNPRIVRAFLNKTGDTIAWLQEKGLDFEIKLIYPNQKFRVWHWPLNGCGGELVRVLTDYCTKRSVKFMTKTSGKRILRDAKGKISGVVAEQGGREFTIKTSNVIIATGSFCGNQNFLKKYCTDYYEGMDGFNHPFHTGDGLVMAAEIGASIAETIPVIHDGPNPDYGPTPPQHKPAYTAGPFGGIIKEPFNMWVNKNGQRFIDESAGFMVWESGNAILLQPGKVMYCLFDDVIREKMEEKGLLMGRGWGEEEVKQRISLPNLKKQIVSAAKNYSFIKVADSWEEMAEWIGAEPEVLKAEVAAYNSYHDHGYDAIFAKEKRYLEPLVKPPYYAIRGVTSCGETLGGIIINERMEVLDSKNKVIPGLYAVGNIADGWESQTYCAECCGSVFAFAINSGRMAGENAADRILK